MTMQQSILYQGDSWRIYWYDDTHTILVGEVTGKWSWSDAYELLSTLNNTIHANSKLVNTILWFTTPLSRAVPRGAGFSLIYRFMNEDVPDEDLFIMVNAAKLLEVLLTTVIRTYNMIGWIPKYRYVKTFDAAIEMVEEHLKITGGIIEHNSQ